MEVVPFLIHAELFQRREAVKRIKVFTVICVLERFLAVLEMTEVGYLEAVTGNS
jgi:hypothetical protein